MGNTLCQCQWLLEDSSPEYHNPKGLMIASRKKIKPSEIPLGQLCLSDVILEDNTEDYDLPQPKMKPRSKSDHESMIIVQKNGCEFAQERKSKFENYLTDAANVPIGISQIKLKAKRKQMLQLAMRKRLENQLIFR
ncbi:unnamed protein product [Moneuplotes crassus]|uniref:Uncharacterized protein n=1 Tax=Euplotes crassus TaxID=5936 RepID=A0AAD1ULD8_EUPCR|nr:unnamed protein product [Moneuplotes crassus]